MYIQNQYAEPRIEVVHSFLRSHPFCSLITTHSDELYATHLPMILALDTRHKGVLRGHIARANPQWKLGQCEAMAIFTGPDAYVTPSLYPSKRKNGRVVPTWNYIVTHVYGKLRFIDDPNFVRQNVEELTTLMESDSDQPWNVSDAPSDYLAKMLRAIVGVELEILEIQAKSKLSQNRSVADFNGVMTGLAQSRSPSARQVAEAMKVTGRRKAQDRK